MRLYLRIGNLVISNLNRQQNAIHTGEVRHIAPARSVREFTDIARVGEMVCYGLAVHIRRLIGSFGAGFLFIGRQHLAQARGYFFQCRNRIINFFAGGVGAEAKAQTAAHFFT